MPPKNLAYIAVATGQSLLPAEALSYPGWDSEGQAECSTEFSGISGAALHQGPDAEGGLAPDISNVHDNS